MDIESDTCHILSSKFSHHKNFKLLTLTSEDLKMNNERNLYGRLNHGTENHRVPVVNTIILTEVEVFDQMNGRFLSFGPREK